MQHGPQQDDDLAARGDLREPIAKSAYRHRIVEQPVGVEYHEDRGLLVGGNSDDAFVQ